MRHAIAAISVLALSACGMNGTDRYKDEKSAGASPTASSTVSLASQIGYQPFSASNLADTMASNDAASYVNADGMTPTENTDPDFIPDSQKRPIMQTQVVLDRQGFGPGVIDGKMGTSTHNALRGFQEARGLPVTGELDQATKEAIAQWNKIPATRVVTIPASWGQIDYRPIPDSPEAQAKMTRLGYTSLDEKLAERFHTTLETLKSLNPGGRPAGASGSSVASPMPTPSPSGSSSGSETEDAKPVASYFSAGQRIRVPNIGADRIAPDAVSNSDWQKTLASLGVGTDQPKAAKIVVSKSKDTLKVYGANGKLIAEFTDSSGSSHDPLPIGDWKIKGVDHDPSFSFNPDLLWDVPDSESKQQLPPGPNGPVGVVWIALSKPHYGIHGTPDPQLIGRTQSHGCVRLTNWDAARLAQMVSTNTEVQFVA